MMARGMCALTGKATALEAWREFVVPADVVGIKVNCGGYPWCISAYEIVAEIVRQLGAAGVPPTQVYVYERFQNQLDKCNYAPHLPAGVTIVAAETANRRADNRGYDPATYVEADLFGEEDTRSNMMRLVTQKLTKIINVPNMKDHGATGATGCLKNIAYGSFSNVARTHYKGKSHTYSFVGTLASAEPLRSRTVLQIMDGLRGVWHAGPFARTRKYVFYPKQILFGTDPVAIDRLLLDIIDDKRKAMGAISIYDRDPGPSRSTTGARAMPIPTSTSSSVSPATCSSRPASASAWPTRRRSRSRTSWCDPPPLAGHPALPLLDARAGDGAHAQGRRPREGVRAGGAGRRLAQGGLLGVAARARRSSSCATHCPCRGSARGPIAPPPPAAPG